jgi:hypothetical protein
MWTRAFQVACACCKADGANVPEVEAVIQLLLPLVRAAYEEIVTDVVDQGVDLLLDNDSLTDEALALLLAAYTAQATRRGLRPLSVAATRTVQQAALSLAPGAGAGVAASAAQQLLLQLEALIERAVLESVPTASRIAGATAFAGNGPEAVLASRAALAEALDVQAALLPLLDAWAYQTFNAGAVRAAAARGENFIQLVAQIDNKTTNFCRLVNGRVIPMARALAQLQRISDAVAAGDVNALIAAAPFHPNPSQATLEEVNAILDAGGLAPFHHRCRTRNVPVRLPVAS